MSERPRFHALTRILIIIGVLAVLLTLAFPVMGMAVRTRNPMRIVLPTLVQALDGYAHDQGGRYPSLHAPGTRVPAALFRSETLGAFTLLSVWSNGDLPAVFFWPKTKGYAPPTITPRMDGGGWLDQPAVLAYDWAAPRDAMPDRPLAAERDPDGRSGIFIADASGRVQGVDVLPGLAETPPVNDSDPPLPWSAMLDGDDLFTRTGDGPGMDVVGGGSATRCFLK
jgi:hypothetical protein